jgi:hypothetical protein
MVAISAISALEVVNEDMQKRLGLAPALPIGTVAKDQRAGDQTLEWATTPEPGVEHLTATATVKRLLRLAHRFMVAAQNRSYRSAGCDAVVGYLHIPQVARAL